MDFARTMFGSLPTENSERLMLAIKADADTVQYGATPPPVPVSQTLNGLGFFVCWRRFPRQKPRRFRGIQTGNRENGIRHSGIPANMVVIPLKVIIIKPK